MVRESPLASHRISIELRLVRSNFSWGLNWFYHVESQGKQMKRFASRIAKLGGGHRAKHEHTRTLLLVVDLEAAGRVFTGLHSLFLTAEPLWDPKKDLERCKFNVNIDLYGAKNDARSRPGLQAKFAGNGWVKLHFLFAEVQTRISTGTTI